MKPCSTVEDLVHQSGLPAQKLFLMVLLVAESSKTQTTVECLMHQSELSVQKKLFLMVLLATESSKTQTTVECL